MKIEELRVGNLVKDRKGQIREVRGIDSYSEDYLWLKIPTCDLATGRHSINDVQPIKIDEGILLKCGFEKSMMPNIFDLGDYHIYIGADKCMYLRYIGFTLAKIDYLHELQNLYYALTKKELDVKL